MGPCLETNNNSFQNENLMNDKNDEEIQCPINLAKYNRLIYASSAYHRKKKNKAKKKRLRLYFSDFGFNEDECGIKLSYYEINSKIYKNDTGIKFTEPILVLQAYERIFFFGCLLLFYIDFN